jgi:hypothetical protein
MSRIRRRNAFPHHWPINMIGMQNFGLQGPAACPAPTAACGVPPAAPLPSNGELAASPWLGLHYETEDM